MYYYVFFFFKRKIGNFIVSAFHALLQVILSMAHNGR